ncbi:MAG: Phytochelatin synthase [Myxococcales bacterium]|nr:Phytochelatin synthase [Myxococcales bacterium]
MRRKRLVLGSLVFVALLGAGVAVGPQLLFSDGVDYSSAVSIKGAPEYQDPTLLAAAWQLPVAATYRNVEYQHNPSFCGPTSAINVMHSLGQAGEQAHILDGTGVKSYFGLLFGGITLDRLADVVREKSGRKVTVLRDLDLAAFRAEVAKSNDPTRRYIVNFHRGPLFGKGGGHHSPIAGYLADKDLVLVVDVNRQYQPWLVKTDRLFSAVDSVDRATKKKRGLLLVQ